jgi:hypothetical protein
MELRVAEKGEWEKKSVKRQEAGDNRFSAIRIGGMSGDSWPLSPYLANCWLRITERMLLGRDKWRHCLELFLMQYRCRPGE